MSKLIELEKAIRVTIETELKNKKIAVNFLDQLTKLLTKPAFDIWGKSINNIEPFWDYMKNVTKNVSPNRERTNIYFRYDKFEDNRPGFYKMEEYGYSFEATKIEELRGGEFWFCIECILNWTVHVLEDMEKRNISRTKLAEKLKIILEVIDND